MSDAVQPLNFAAYAKVYDLLYRDKDYAAEAAYILSRLTRNGFSATRTLELGCGTAAHAPYLLDHGLDLVGIDLSPTMLAMAQERRASLTAAQAARLRFAEGDVRTLRLDDRFDTIISLFHVASYQQSDADLLAMFTTAASHLAAGGAFVFDYWYAPGVLAQRPERRVKVVEDPALTVERTAEAVTDLDRRLVTITYEVAVTDKASGAVSRFTEDHVMRYWYADEIEALLERAGFRTVQTCGWLRETAPDPSDWAACTVATR